MAKYYYTKSEEPKSVYRDNETMKGQKDRSQESSRLPTRFRPEEPSARFASSLGRFPSRPFTSAEIQVGRVPTV